MLQITLGEMLRRFRIEKEVDAKQVCKGLCSPAMMSYFEKGTRVPDTLLFEYLMERMGVSPELFSVMISKEVYEYCEWKAQVCNAIENEKWDELEKILSVKHSIQKKSKHKIVNQFHLYVNAICEGIKGKYAEATTMLEEAALQTIPNMQEISKENVLLSAIEIHIMILYMLYGVKSRVMSIEEGAHLFEVLESYIYNEKMGMDQRTKCYSKLISVGVPMLSNHMSEKKQMKLCQRAFSLLRTSKTFYNIIELFEVYVPLLIKNNCQEKNYYIKQQEVFIDICRIENSNVVSRPEQFVISKPKYYMIHEFLSSKRREHGLTQEEVIENICEPETYSRVENGKREPSRKNLQALAEKLDINWCYYRGEIDTAELNAYELRRKHRLAEINGDREESLEILSELEKCLDMKSIINVQYVKSNEYIAKFRLNRMLDEETFCGLKKLLELTQKEYQNTKQLVYYSQTELEIIAHMAQILRHMKQPQEGINLIQTIIKQLQNSKILITYQWNGFSFVLRELSGLYFEIGDYETAITISEFVKKEEIKRRDGESLPGILDAIADCLEHLGEQYSDEYKKLYRYTYYIAEFFSIERIEKPAKKYYEERFDSEIVWY